MLILGLETSCDETAVGIVGDDRRILADRVASQLEEHRPYGGVVPEIAARTHLDRLDDLIRLALEDAKLTLGEIDGVAATCGPGLIGGVMVGAMTGKAIAAVRKLPFIAVNHLEAHALTARLTDDVKFPYLLLLISGGHCQLIVVKGVGEYRLLGTTIDDAVGECFDKSAKLLGLGYPGGPMIELAAEGGNAKAYELPQPMLGRAGCDFSFSGLKTAVRLLVENSLQGRSNSLPLAGRVGVGGVQQGTKQELIGEIAPDVTPPLLTSPARGEGLDRPFGNNGSQFQKDAAASLQATIAGILYDRTKNAFGMLQNDEQVTALVAAGGVAANTAIREKLVGLAREYKLPFVAPPPRLCTDNGVMIAWTGVERLRLGFTDGLDTAARPRWPLDEKAKMRTASR